MTKDISWAIEIHPSNRVRWWWEFNFKSNGCWLERKTHSPPWDLREWQKSHNCFSPNLEFYKISLIHLPFNGASFSCWEKRFTDLAIQMKHFLNHINFGEYLILKCNCIRVERVFIWEIVLRVTSLSFNRNFCHYFPHV